MWRQVRDEPLVVCVTNASSPIAYNFLQWLISGQICPADRALMIRLLVPDRERERAAKGVAMEMVDCAQGMVRSVIVTGNSKKAFADCSLVVVLDEPEGDSIGDVQGYADRLKTYSAVIAKHSQPHVMVAVAGSHANLGATVVWRVADDSVVFKKSRQVIAVGQVGERRARALLASRLGVGSHQVENVVAWGRVDHPCLLTTTEAHVYRHMGAVTGPDDYGKRVTDVLHDHKWLASSLLEEVQSVKSKPMVSAAGIAQFVRLWVQPACATAPDRLFSIGLISNGQFGLPEHVAFSMPARMSVEEGWQAVREFPVSVSEASVLLTEAQRLSEEATRVLSALPPHPSHL